jgi:molecular chaperone Hsp33
MTLAEKIAWDDMVLPFQLDRSDIRGRVVRLDGVLDAVLAQHAYPAAVEALVAETALLTAMIGQTIKLRWKLSLQVRGDGPIRVIATDYFAPETPGAAARMRAWAGFDADRVAGNGPGFDQLGRGYVALMLDQGPGSTPYQGITPLAGRSLADCAAAYFAQSEQLPTRFALSAGRASAPGGEESWRAGGLMLQMMPAAPPRAGGSGPGADGLTAAHDLLSTDEAEGWNRANMLLDTVEAMELVGPHVSPADLLVRLFHRGSAACVRCPAGRLWLHLLRGQGAPEPVDLFRPRHRHHDHRGRRRHRRLPVLRRALPARPGDAGPIGRDAGRRWLRRCSPGLRRRSPGPARPRRIST